MPAPAAGDNRLVQTCPRKGASTDIHVPAVLPPVDRGGGAVVDSFTARYPATYTELHINKVCGARVFFALLYSGESPLSTVPACIKASTFDGTVVSVYSGLEDVCVRHDSLPPVHVDEQLIRKGHFWLIKHDWRNVLQVREADARLRSPFVPTPGFISADELNTYIMMDSIKRYDDLHHRGIIY